MAEGVNKLVTIKKEASWGTKPDNTGGQLLPRVTCALNLEKTAFSSAAINPSQQVRDSRHGTRSATGSLEGELMGSAYELLIAGALRRDFSGSVTTGAIIVVAASSTGYERSTGSFITDGFRAGMIVDVSGFTTAANNGRKVVTAVTATDLTARSLDGTAMTTEAEGDSVTIALAGQITYTPGTGQTDDTFTAEEWFSDISLSRTFLGLRVNTMNVNATPDSMVTLSFDLLGKDAETPTGSRYFASPSAVPAEGTMSSASNLSLGLLGGVKTCKINSLQITLNNNVTQEPTIFCPAIGGSSRGKVMVSGSVTALIEDDTYLELFDQETETTFHAIFAAQDGEVVSFFMPRFKINSASVDDGEKVLIVTANFEALEYVGANTGVLGTTMVVQDSTVS